MKRPARTRIKICGVRDLDIADRAIDAGADALGFVFHPPSPRFVEPAEAWSIIRRLPPFVTTVGLTVNLTFDEFSDLEQCCPTDYTQLHGEESTELAAQCGPRIVKAIQFRGETIADDLETWTNVDEVEAILIDGSSGGMGTAFDWNALKATLDAITKPIILAGGLTPANVAEAVSIVRPFAVDVSSGVESERGVKSPDLIRRFCDAVRTADEG